MIGVNNTTGRHLDGIEHLKQSVRDILLTPLGTRVMRREYGSRLFDLIDAPINSGTIVEIVAATAEALAKWEPRIEIERVLIVDPTDPLGVTTASLNANAKARNAILASGHISLTILGNYLPDGKPVKLEYINLPLISGTVQRIYPEVTPPPSVEISLGGAAVAIATAAGELGLEVVAEKTFYGGFDLGDIVGAGSGGNHNWYAKQESTPGRISLISDGEGGYIGRFEIQASDGGGAPARSEVLLMQDASGNPLYEDMNSGTQVYRFRTKFDSTWQPLTNTESRWAHFCRLMSRNELSGTPTWSLLATSDGAVNRIVLEMRGGDIDINQATWHELAINSLNPGSWIDWIVTVKYGNSDATGAICVERKTEGESVFTRVIDLPHIATLQYRTSMFSGSTDPHYLKIGLYRNVETSTAVIFHDGFTREPGLYAELAVSLAGAAEAIATAIGTLMSGMMPTFFGGFDLGEICGLGSGGNHNWYDKQESVPGQNISLLLSPNGGYFGKFQINTGDGGGGIQHAQVLICQDEAGNSLNETLDSGTQVYRLSTKFDLSWQSMANAVPIARFFACHGRYELEASDPAWALNACDASGNNVIVLSVFAGDIDSATRIDYALTDNSLNLGEWIDWIVTVKYGNSADSGAISIARRNEGASIYSTVLNLANVATMQYRSSLFDGATDPHYLKLGLVRNEEAFTSIIYHDNFTREPEGIPLPPGELAGAAYAEAIATGTLAGDISMGGHAYVVATAAGALTVSGAETVAVPNLYGMTQSQANAAIVAAGLIVGTITHPGNGTVTGQNPTASTQVALDTDVDYTLSSGITFWGNFDNGVTSGHSTGNGHNFYGETSQGSGSNGIQLIADGSGGYYAKFTVNPGTPGGNERYEVYWMQKTNNDLLPENLNSGTVIYRFRTKFDASWQELNSDSVQGRWMVMAQCHGHDDYATNPAWSMGCDDHVPNVLGMGIRGGNLNTNQGQDWVFNDGSLRIGEWIDWIITVKYGMTDATGSMKVERKNQGASVYTTVLNLPNIATLQYRPDLFGGLPGDHYFRLGCYSSYQNWTRILYHDNFTREQG